MEIPVAQLTYYHLAAVAEEKHFRPSVGHPPERAIKQNLKPYMQHVDPIRASPSIWTLEQSAVAESVAVDSHISQP